MTQPPTEHPEFLRFCNAMLAFGQPIIEAEWKRAEKNENPLPRSKHFSLLWDGYTEIVGCLDGMKMARELLQLDVRSFGDLKRAEYLRFILGGYMNEGYMLKERMTTYATQVSRMYCDPGQNPKPLHDLPGRVEQAFDAHTKWRGAHVHSVRYDTRDLNTLSSVDLIVESSIEESEENARDTKRYGNALYDKQREYWSAKMTEGIDSIEAALGQYFGELLQVIAKDGLIFVPSRPPRKTGR